MKTLFSLLSLVVLFSFVSMTTEIDYLSSHKNTYISPAALKTKTHFLQQLQQLSNVLENLTKSLKNKDLSTSRKTYLKARIPFKQVEFLIAYLDHQLYEKSINESPLLKPEPKVANKEIHHPKGFQVIDELLFKETVDFEALIKLSDQLGLEINTLSSSMQFTRFYDAMIIHAIKEQLIRSFTLGITGFDTPSSDNSMTDFRVVNQGILTTLEFYQERFSREMLLKIKHYFENIQYQSFEEFDRYGYLVEQLIPILECLEQIRVRASLESKEELYRLPLPINSSFTNPFQTNFFNSTYYTNIPNKEATQTRIALGKQLFNDPILSDNLQTSCATCHNEQKAFTDELPQSMNGDKSHTTSRNSPSLNYSIYASAYFYDLRAHDLKNQFDHVIHNEKEFNSNYGAIIKKLATDSIYIQQFQSNYAEYTNTISSSSINHALKCYLMSLPRFDSPFDQLVQNKQTAIPKAIRQGFNLFMGKAQCATCHFPPTFSGLVPPSYSDSESEVLGVLINENYDDPVLDADKGRKVNGVVKDNFDFFEHSFKTVSIRNAQITAPYMHNGSIKSLEKVIEFYDLGGGLGMGLNLPHQTLPSDKLNLTDNEKEALIAFIESLTDKAYE